MEEENIKKNQQQQINHERKFEADWENKSLVKTVKARKFRWDERKSMKDDQHYTEKKREKIQIYNLIHHTPQNTELTN